MQQATFKTILIFAFISSPLASAASADNAPPATSRAAASANVVTLHFKLAAPVATPTLQVAMGRCGEFALEDKTQFWRLSACAHDIGGADRFELELTLENRVADTKKSLHAKTVVVRSATLTFPTASVANLPLEVTVN